MCDAWANLGYNDHQLSTAAGQLCLRAQVWGQAKKNFEDAIRTAPDSAKAINYAGLAQALRGMGDIAAAQEAEHQATQLNQVKVLETH